LRKQSSKCYFLDLRKMRVCYIFLRYFTFSSNDTNYSSMVYGIAFFSCSALPSNIMFSPNSALHCSVVSWSVPFCSISLHYFSPCFGLACSGILGSVLSCYILNRSRLLYSTLLCVVLLVSVLLCSILLWSVLLCSVLVCSAAPETRQRRGGADALSQVDVFGLSAWKDARSRSCASSGFFTCKH